MVPFIFRIWHTLLSFYQLRIYLGARGEIGKHSRLKICRPRGLAGSSPAERTTLHISSNVLKNNEKNYEIVVFPTDIVLRKMLRCLNDRNPAE